MGRRRSLHRLTQVTAAAQRIGAGSTLEERLALTGPHDEVRELGDTFEPCSTAWTAASPPNASSPPTPPTSCAPP
ncbi:HAMP domain-containing protein [Streptomyces sp. NPDC058746]|uniref:HAMP domain-containing protein n=1 Tax=Streptomyces sp. NPDC058746 TaxID=3346622 RepID=UPI0036C65C6A